MKLKGKTAIVTGSSQGIGLGCALEMAKQGAEIILNDRPGSEILADAVKEVEKLGVAAHGVEADAYTREGAQSITDAAMERFGKIDILVSVPGFNLRDSFLDFDPDNFEKNIAGVLTAGFHMSQLSARQMVKRGQGGKIIFISSVLAEVANARCLAYTAGKAGLNQMMRLIAVEMFEHHINVNAIEPGWIDTPGERISYDDDTMEVEGRKLPWGRLGTPEDIGKAATFLASADADYITGVSLPVDGGYKLRHCREIPPEK
ncbi:MAG: SDR family NAD(P)-dependent oxidoreductase [Verrucomicrobiales bacterium]|nr:SDR family NAD(P)-dependent oxidoreductase [Verrucomicrobiales bacterium]